MIYAIHAYEDVYGGYHGIEEWGFIEAESEEDESLIATAQEMCGSLISSYGLEDEYLEGFEDLDEEELGDFVLEHYAWDTIPLPKATSVEECERLYNDNNDPEGICEMFQ